MPMVKPHQGRSKPTKDVNPDVKLQNWAQLDFPVYMMHFPLRMDTDDANNVWMQKLPESERKVDYPQAYMQWMQLYDALSSGGGFVDTLPNTKDFQDLVYVANIGIVLLHGKEPVYVASRYRSEPRKGEEKIGLAYFQANRFKTAQAPLDWEGEADLKHVVDNVYVGGYGIRTDPKVYDWFEKTFDMKVVRVKMTDQALYHFDCQFFPLQCLPNPVSLVCTSIMEKSEVKAIEKVTDIIDVPVRLAHAAITNCVRFREFVCCGGWIPQDKHHPDYKDEIDKQAFMLKHLPPLGFEPWFFKVTEFEKSGAAVSCLVCHINRASYTIPLTS